MFNNCCHSKGLNGRFAFTIFKSNISSNGFITGVFYLYNSILGYENKLSFTNKSSIELHQQSKLIITNSQFNFSDTQIDSDSSQIYLLFFLIVLILYRTKFHNDSQLLFCRLQHFEFVRYQRLQFNFFWFSFSFKHHRLFFSLHLFFIYEPKGLLLQC